MARPERLFDRYRRKGDLDALGAVFDRLAPGLLRVAMHFAPDPAAAEDLLQETFLSAIANASRYDGTRPLRPWLAGILRNHARQGWRRRVRDEAKSLPAELTARDAPDVSDDIAWSRALSEHIEELPSPMRQVLVLRLKHGMAPADIAELLDVAPATVRTRLHRGLAKLRDRMPSEARPAALLMLPIPVGLSAIRTQVLASASKTLAVTTLSATGTALAVPILGGLVMTQKTLVVAAAVVLPVLAGGLAWMGGVFDPPDVPHETRTAKTVKMPEPEKADAPKLQVGERTEPETPEPKPQAAPPPKPDVPQRVPLDAPIPVDKGSVAGVVRFEDGTPLRDTPLALWGSPNVVSTTDDEGRFHIHADWVSDRDLFIKKDDEYTLLLTPTRMRKGKLVTVDVTLVRGIDMAAQVVDAETNKPLAGAKVTLRRNAQDTQAHAGFANTDKDGRFHFEYLPRVIYTFELNCDGYQATIQRLDLKEGPAPTKFTMKPAKPLTIALAGLPEAAKGTKVQFHFTGMGNPLNFGGKGEINHDGHLVIDAPDPGRYILTIFKTGAVPRIYELIQFDANTRRVDIALPAAGRVLGSVRDRKGEPLKKVRLQIGKQMAYTDDEGRFDIPSAAAGKYDVWIYPKKSSFRYGKVDVVAGQDTRLDITLRGGSEVTLRVLLDGAPVGRHGATVSVLDATSGAIIGSGWVESEGRVQVSHLARGSYRLEIKSRKALPKSMSIDLGIEQKLDLGDVSLHAFVSIPVRLVLPEGVTFADVRMSGILSEADLDAMRRGLLGGRLVEKSDGSIALTGMRPGTRRFRVSAKGCQPLEIEVTLPRTDPEPLEIRLDVQ